MKKIFIFLFFFISISSADILFQKIENFMEKKQFQTHNKLIHSLFRNKNEFYKSSGQIDYILLLETLKKKGFLNLKLHKPNDLNVEFNTNADTIKSFKILNKILKEMGYSYYFTKSINFDKTLGILSWKIAFKGEYMIDPFFLAKELEKQYCYIVDIEKVNNKYWKYTIDVNNSKIIEAIKIANNERVVLRKPLRPYFLEVGKSTKLNVSGRILNHWFPYIAFYDNHLNLLKSIKEKRIHRVYHTNIPLGTKYIKISDLYTLINIKRGLSVVVK
ncbi:Putative periplasmic protein [hydrothermal vent metagenome]|uniref:Periplasmic protein n=1 Tax=hydrothermal vent metagenome TaxID=652676 RepID=A0A3B1E7A2_9ZZZZ